jgi:hypothetical protein
MIEGFLISIPGITLLLMAWCGLVMWRRRRRLRLAEEHGVCLICGTPFSEAMIDYQGAVSAAERAAMDRFQARFAVFKIHCQECGTVNICTRDGRAYKAVPPP